jgi:hypoxanthine phosphoribosyltransferase
VDNLQAREPKSIKVCALLKKENSAQVEVPVDFVGFNIPNKFVVGYGLDVAEKFRNLPMIAVFHP